MQLGTEGGKLLRALPPNAADDSGVITYKDLEEIRTMKNPADVVRRTLEVTFLIIGTSSRTLQPEPPAWSAVQRKLGDAQFLSQVLSCDPASLRAQSAIMTFIAWEYFCTGSATAISAVVFAPMAAVVPRATRVSMRDLMTRSASGTQNLQISQAKNFRSKWKTMDGHGGHSDAKDGQEPLSVERVLRASTSAAVLLRWCAAMLEIASSPSQDPDEASPARAALDKIKAQVSEAMVPSRALPALSLPSAARAKCGRIQVDNMLSPRTLGARGAAAAGLVPRLALQAPSPASPSSAPSSFRQRANPGSVHRLEPLGLNEKLQDQVRRRGVAIQLQAGGSSSSSSTVLGSGTTSQDVTVGLGSARFILDNATERVQSLAMAKIELRQRAKQSPRKEQMKPLPVVPRPSIAPAAEKDELKRAASPEIIKLPEPSIPEVKPVVQDDTVAKATEMIRQRAIEKAQAVENVIVRRRTLEEKEDEVPPNLEDEPWRAFHASYMRAEESSSSPTEPAEPVEKTANKALKQMERAMKSWEDTMKKAAKADVDVVQHDKLLKGGFLESVVCFSTDSDQLTENQETILRTVAATVRMREKLHLQLIGCGVELDGPVAIMRRLCNVQQFFEEDGIPCNAVHAVRTGNQSFIRPTWIQSDRQARYVLCRLHMNDDMELCGHLLGTLYSEKKKTRDQASWLKSNFEIITY